MLPNQRGQKKWSYRGLSLSFSCKHLITIAAKPHRKRCIDLLAKLAGSLNLRIGGIISAIDTSRAISWSCASPQIGQSRKDNDFGIRRAAYRAFHTAGISNVHESEPYDSSLPRGLAAA